jgi:hypothetical protein
MSRTTATQEIHQKRQDLRAAGFDVGPPLAEVRTAGSGGFVQEFENAHIYWHRAAGAHEVRGAILHKYLELGGPGHNPRTGRRDFGYPITGEERSAFGDPQSRFELGEITSVRGAGTVALYGGLNEHITERDGFAITDPLHLPEGDLVYTKRGCLLRTEVLKRNVRGRLSAPTLGKPGLISSDASQTLPITVQYSLAPLEWEEMMLLAQDSPQAEERAIDRLAGYWQGKLCLQGVRDKANVWPLVLALAEKRQATPLTIIEFGVRPESTQPLPERELFDVSLRLPDGRLYPLYPHALYTRGSWDQVRLMHATDLHISERVELFRSKLRARGRTRAAREMVNPNDSVRALFRYANSLHARGELDIILVTGDLVDYIYEAGQLRTAGGNFGYFEQLVLGQAGPRDEADVESQELHVPIFTVLGHSDYVVNSYDLLFTLDAPGWRETPLSKYYPFGLTASEARIIQGGVHKVSTGRAQDMMLSSREETAYYRRWINASDSYIVDVGGKHRIAMLDTGPVIGGSDDIGEALMTVLGFVKENDAIPARRAPTHGVLGDLPMLRQALDEPTKGGVFIIGMHAPPLNPRGNEYPHYFRESERPLLESQRLDALVRSYFGRQNSAAEHDSWPRQGALHFKQGDLDDLLNFGIASDGVTDLLRLCAGGKVDVVLCGHTHERAEFRLKPDGQGGFLFFTDFYTENPSEYRASHDREKRDEAQRIHIVVDAQAKAGEMVEIVRDQRDDGFAEFRRLRVPPYPDTLRDATNKRAWWKRHRPLILQTACLGPVDYSQRRPSEGRALKPEVSFQGVRLVAVDGDHISSIRYVGIDEIRGRAAPEG